MLFNSKIFKEYAEKFGMPEAQYDNSYTNNAHINGMQWLMPLAQSADGGYICLRFFKMRRHADESEKSDIVIHESTPYTYGGRWWGFTVVPADANLAYKFRISVPSINKVVGSDATIDELHNVALTYARKKMKEKKKTKMWRIRAEAATDYTDVFKNVFTKHGYENTHVTKKITEKAKPWPFLYSIKFDKESGPIKQSSFLIEVSRSQDKFNVYYYQAGTSKSENLYEMRPNCMSFQGSIGIFKTKEDTCFALEKTVEYVKNCIKQREMLTEQLNGLRIKI